MKKTIFAVCLFLTMTGLMLSGAEKRVPVMWKSSVRPPYKNFQTYAFGFLGEAKEYTFVFQIKNLAGFLQSERPFLTCYFNADNDAQTGLFPKKCGWDLQFNLDLKRNNLAAMFWRRESLESTYSFAQGEFLVYQQDDLLFLTVQKNVYFKNIRFGRNFTFAQLLASPDLDGKKTRSMVETPQQTTSGEFGKQAFILPDLRMQKLAEQAKENK